MNSFLFERELFIPSTIEGLEECLCIVKQIGNDFNMDFERKFCLQTITLESVENAITHGNNNRRELKVRFKIWVTLSEVVIEVEDTGNGFDIKTVPSPICNLNIRKESGRGLYFIKCFSKRFYLVGKGNIIKIYIKR